MKALGLEPRTHGLKGRCSDDVSDDGATTHDDDDQALTDLLTYFSRKWPDLVPVVRAWPALSEQARAAILTVVPASQTRTKCNEVQINAGRE